MKATIVEASNHYRLQDIINDYMGSYEVVAIETHLYCGSECKCYATIVHNGLKDMRRK